MKIKVILAAGAAALCAMGASAASATEYEAIYTGTIYDSYDYTGVFGPADSSLDGDAFVATYTFNTAVGDRTTIPGVSDHLDNGGPFGFPGGETATLTINGVTVSFGGTYSWSTDAMVDRRINGVADTRTLTPLTDQLIFNIVLPPSAPPLFGTYPLTSVSSGDGHFGDYTAPGGVLIDDFATGYFDNMTYEVVEVPEPATWALVLAGFAGLGAVLRSRLVRRTEQVV
ncbi:MAG TPA: PEPxxWA-CTERM sorting domain-containing protein [Caulobacteraceae bacterium]|jgi:hypothetical protein